MLMLNINTKTAENHPKKKYIHFKIKHTTQTQIFIILIWYYKSTMAWGWHSMGQKWMEREAVNRICTTNRTKESQLYLRNWKLCTQYLQSITHYSIWEKLVSVREKLHEKKVSHFPLSMFEQYVKEYVVNIDKCAKILPLYIRWDIHLADDIKI